MEKMQVGVIFLLITFPIREIICVNPEKEEESSKRVMKIKKATLLILALACGCASFAGEGAAAVPAYPNFDLDRTHAMMFLVLQIGIILFAAKIGGALAAKLRMPSILGELGAGIVIGPWALGGIGFGDGIFKYGLFHGAALRTINAISGPPTQLFGTVAQGGTMFDATSPELYGIATLASVILLFLSGLETNFKMFLKYSFVGSMVGVGGVVVSFVLGDACAVYFLPMFFDSFADAVAGKSFIEAMMMPGPLYMGIMSTATSVGITARILSERKKMDSEEGVTIMAGAVIDDVLGLIVLAIGNGIIAANIASANSGGAAASAGVDWGHIGMVAVKAFGVWLGATAVGVVFARWIAFAVKLGRDPKVMATLAFGLAMILAGFFESMHLAMIIGAYVMGLSLSRTDLKHLIQENLEPVYTFLVPVFFCVMGMMVDISALCSKPVLMFGLIYSVLAVTAKIIGCALPSMLCGFNTIGALRIGAGMVPRGEVALIIAGIGLSQGYLSQEIFGVGILMTLITTVVAPPALVGMFIPKKRGVRHPRKENTPMEPVRFTLPTEEIARFAMTKLLLEFDKEGFYTYRFNPEGTIVQVSKDTFEISMTLDEATIEIECAPEEAAIVDQAWKEVVSQIRSLAAAIESPLTQRSIKKLSEAAAPTPETPSAEDAVKEKDKMRSRSIVNTIANFVMVPDFKATSKRDAFERLTQLVAAANPKIVKDQSALLAAIEAREDAMPTGLNNGLAVPHGRTDAVSEIVGAVAIVDNSNRETGTLADYETIDHSIVRVIVLTLAPESTQSPYLQLMAFVSRSLRGENGFNELVSCKTPDEMRNFFKKVK